MAEALGRDDHADVLALVSELTATTDLDSFIDTTLRGLLDLVPSVDASYNEMNPLAQRARFDVWPDPGGDLLTETIPTFGKLMRQNPLVEHMERTGDTRTLMWSDFVTVDHIRGTELHAALYSRLGVDSQMAVALPAPQGVVVGFALNRGPEGFTERDRAILNTLRPHLCQTYRSVLLRAEVSALRAALAASGWNTALVTDDGEVVELTDGTTEAMASVDLDFAAGRELPQPLRDDFLPAVAEYHPSHQAVLSRAIRLSDGAHGVAGWYVPSPVPPHVVLVRAAVDLSIDRLAEAGLTPRQIDVALALLDGGTNAQLAVRLGVAEGTLRKHLEHIYARLGVDNRTSAIAAVHDTVRR